VQDIAVRDCVSGDPEWSCDARGAFDLQNHLLAGEEAIGDEFARTQGDLSLRHDCGGQVKGA
jgi:hypothetical protein